MDRNPLSVTSRLAGSSYFKLKGEAIDEDILVATDAAKAVVETSFVAILNKLNKN